MVKNISKLTFLLLIALIQFIPLGCSTTDVPFVIDSDEIIKFIDLDPTAKELFNRSAMFPTAVYDIPHLQATFSDRILGTTRRVEIEMIPLWKIISPSDSVRRTDAELEADYGNLGSFREAWAIVKDSFLIETTRMFTTDTTVDTTARVLFRYGFFLKLGDDTREFLGWSLWGFRGREQFGDRRVATTVFANINTVDTSFSGDGDVLFYDQTPRSNSSFVIERMYVKLSDIPRIGNGASLGLQTEWIVSGTTDRDYPLVNYNADNGYNVVAMGQSTPETYFISVDLKDNNPNRYDIVYFQTFLNDSIQPTDFWVVPYQM